MSRLRTQRRKSGRVPRQSGFSLLEVLVAFSILALALGVLLQAFSTGVRGVTQSGLYSRAMLLAESKLAQAGRDEALYEGEHSGEFDDIFRWRVAVIPYEAEDMDPRKLSLDPVAVTVEVEWDEGDRTPRIALTGLRLLPGNR
jgi:general secretion pathway protein I